MGRTLNRRSWATVAASTPAIAPQVHGEHSVEELEPPCVEKHLGVGGDDIGTSDEETDHGPSDPGE